MTCSRARMPLAFALFVCALSAGASPVFAQAGTITKGMQNNCASDYKKFCGEKAGPSLSPACVQALVQTGKISQAEVDRIKAQMKGR